ncbi:hypothetical protein BSKO_00351 [Bryopsis sp. KO-2023]|nr:hypothetical protein BSKO_00351 [Bryopsis sp. KO-2023]
MDSMPEATQGFEPKDRDDGSVTSEEPLTPPSPTAESAPSPAPSPAPVQADSEDDYEDAGMDVTADDEGIIAEDPTQEDAAVVPPEIPPPAATFGEDDFPIPTPSSDRHSSVTNNVDTDIAAISDLESVLEEQAKPSAAAVEDDDDDVEEIIAPAAKVGTRALPTNLFQGGQSSEPVDEQISPAMAATMRSMAAQQEASDTAPVPAPAPAPAPAPSNQPPSAGPTPPAARPSGGMPSLPARPAAPVGLGAGGLPPRAAGPRPSGMGPGLPPRPAMGMRPTAANLRPLGLLVNPRPDGVNNPGEIPEEPPATKEARQKLKDIRVLMLRMASRLELPPMDIPVQEFLNKIDMSERVRFPMRTGPFRPQIDAMYNAALQMERENGAESDLGVSVTALVIGPSKSGKTSVIRNLLQPGFGLADDFAPGPTNKITTYTGKIKGVNYTFIDTPGLSLSSGAMRKNMDILRRAKDVINKKKPNVVIYCDRMDVFRRELTDVPLLRLINEMLPGTLYNAVVMLTRGGAPPPDTAEAAMEYTDYYRHRLDLCLQVVAHAISDMRWEGRPMGFENHPSCPTENGVAILPIGIPFKKQALYHLMSSMMYGEIEKICKTKGYNADNMRSIMAMMPRRQLQLTALVSQLLSSKTPKKYPEEERELKTPNELSKLDGLTRQMEENKRRDYVRMRRVEILQEEQHPTQVPVIGSNLELNPSFDHEVNQHRYRESQFVGGWSVRPIVSAPDGTFDHDDGIEMFQIAREAVLRPKKQCLGGFPGSMIVQAGKGKGTMSITMDAGVSAYCGSKTVVTASTVVHPAGQDGEFVYTPTMDVRLKTADRNKVTLGLMACRLAEKGWPNKGQLSYGAKIEDKFKIQEGVKLITALGLMTMKVTNHQPRDLAYGANADLKLSAGKGEFDPNFILGVGMSTQKKGNMSRTGFSGQISAEKPISRETMVSGRLNMNAGGTGQMTARMVTHDRPLWGWSMAVPLAIKFVKRLTGQNDEIV